MSGYGMAQGQAIICLTVARVIDNRHYYFSLGSGLGLDLGGSQLRVFSCGLGVVGLGVGGFGGLDSGFGLGSPCWVDIVAPPLYAMNMRQTRIITMIPKTQRLKKYKFALYLLIFSLY